MEYKKGCETLVRTDLDGTKVYKDKKKYNTLDEAIEACKKLNSLDKAISKLVSYKCKHCCKYHIGRNGKKLKTKYKEKLKEEVGPVEKPTYNRKRFFDSDLENANLKVVGKIDLDKVPKK